MSQFRRRPPHALAEHADRKAIERPAGGAHNAHQCPSVPTPGRRHHTLPRYRGRVPVPASGTSCDSDHIRARPDPARLNVCAKRQHDPRVSSGGAMSKWNAGHPKPFTQHLRLAHDRGMHAARCRADEHCRRRAPTAATSRCCRRRLRALKQWLDPMQQRVNRRRSMPAARRSRPRSSSNAPATRRPSPVSWQHVPNVGTQHAENNVPPGAPGPDDAQDQSRARRSRPVVATRAPLGHDIWTCWQRWHVRRSRCAVRGRFRRATSLLTHVNHIGLVRG